MKFYFAGWPKDTYGLFARNGVERRLISYWEVKRQSGWQRPKDFFLDSGAFSAFTQGAKIDIDEYCDFVKEHSPDVHSVLDQIGDFEVTKQRQKYMEKKGLSPLPTCHYGATREQIKYWLDGYSHFAIGGMVPHAKFRKRLYAWCDIVFSEAYKVWPKKLHAFGMGAPGFLLRYPCYSADSTSWQRFARYGTSNINFQDSLRIFFTRSDTIQAEKRFDLEVKHHLKMESHLNDVWKRRGILWNE